MADELLMVVARNRHRVLAEITVMMAHRLVDLASMTVWCDEGSDTLCAVLAIRPATTPGGTDMLKKRLNRVVDVVSIVELNEEFAHQCGALS
jgi:acetolactate synthase small subunit